MTNMHRIGMVAFIAMSGCVSKSDIKNEIPMLDRKFNGDFLSVGACVHDAIQTSSGYSISPSVQFITSRDWVEVQTTGTSGITGTIYGQVTRLTDLGDSRFRAVVQAGYTADGDIAIESLMRCVAE